MPVLDLFKQGWEAARAQAAAPGVCGTSLDFGGHTEMWTEGFLWAGGRGQQDSWLGNKVPAAPGLCQRDPRQTALQCTLATCTALSWGCSGFPAPSAKHWSTGEPGVAWHAFTQCWVLLLLLPLVGGLHRTAVTLRRTALEPWAPKCCRSGLYPSAHPQ